jgi:tetratricopeptide (TPR) repeat protein
MKPPPHTAELRQRLRGLSPTQAEMMRQVMRLHAAGDKLMSAQWLLQLAREAPEHPEVLVWQGLRHVESGQWQPATVALLRATALRPDDVKLWALLATAQSYLDDAGAVLHSLAQAERCAGSAADWLKLSIEYDRQGFFEQAWDAADKLLQLAPRSVTGLLQRSRCSKALGRADLAAADCRQLIQMDSEVARAWFALVDLKTVALSADELQLLQTHAQRAGLPQAELQFLEFALGKALEDAGEFESALTVFRRANDRVRAGLPWNSAGFAARAQALQAAFSSGTAAQAEAQGREVIFLVGMPRSGSTLIEQVLASHSSVEGASELPYLNQVIDAESRLRGQPFPAWVGRTTAADWTRLGQDYLRISARWRRQRPIATDKLPDNWMLAGAALAMLPEARVIDCRREALETCWSCYKQLFGPGLAAFSYDFDSMAQYWKACENMGDLLVQQRPHRFRVQSYEALVQAPEVQIRELLEFCGLSFEPGCMSFHTAQRAIRTPSALQVRQPMVSTSNPALRYGELLAPLRAALAARQHH